VLTSGDDPVFSSKGEAKKAMIGNGISLNQSKIAVDRIIVSEDFVIQGRAGLLRKGKKEYIIIEAV